MPHFSTEPKSRANRGGVAILFISRIGLCMSQRAIKKHWSQTPLGAQAVTCNDLFTANIYVEQFRQLGEPQS